MPIDASSDPYDSRAGLDPLGAKVGASDFERAADETDDAATKGGLGSAVDAVDDKADSTDDPSGVVTSKVDASQTDEDLESAGTGAGARAADLDLGGADKSAVDDVDLDDAGSGVKGTVVLHDDVSDLDDAGIEDEADLDDSDSLLKGVGLGLEDLDGPDSLRGAVDDDFDGDVDKSELDDDDADHLDKGDFFDLH